MKRVKRFVFDTNVIVSAMLFSNAKPSLALKNGFRKGVIVVSTETLEELSRVVFDEKFDKYAPAAMRQGFLERYETDCELIEVTEEVSFCRDPDDDKFLSLAKTAKATAIISGDKDLLVLNPFNDIPIITPDEFLKRF